MGCKAFISKGTRFNAAKRYTDETYFSTTILEFQMKCRMCAAQEFVIRTNPRERNFDYVSGIKKHTRNDIHQVELIEQRKKREQTQKQDTTVGDTTSNSDDDDVIMNQLETMARGKRKIMSEVDYMIKAQQFQDQYFQNDADSNATLRTAFRKDRKDRKRRRKEAQALGLHESIVLMDHNPEDAVAAKEKTYGDSKHREKVTFGNVRVSSIFSTKMSNSGKKKSSKTRIGSARKIPFASITSEVDRPDRVISSSIDSLKKSDREDDNDGEPKSKKKLLLGIRLNSSSKQLLKNDGLLVSSSKNWSAMDALGEYGSDSD